MAKKIVKTQMPIAMANSLLSTLRYDIENYLEELRTMPFSNERDLQTDIACYLKQKNYYDKIELEYWVPKLCFIDKRIKNKLKEDVWGNEVHLDLVVNKGTEYCVLELKFKTPQNKMSDNIERFGKIVNISHGGQGAANIGRYLYWKDVRRIEMVTKKFKNVVGGLAVLVTFDDDYWTNNCKKKEDRYFSINENNNTPKPAEKKWIDPKTENTKVKKRNGKILFPNFELNHKYLVTWGDMTSLNRKLKLPQNANNRYRYCEVEVQ